QPLWQGGTLPTTTLAAHGHGSRPRLLLSVAVVDRRRCWGRLARVPFARPLRRAFPARAVQRGDRHGIAPRGHGRGQALRLGVLRRRVASALAAGSSRGTLGGRWRWRGRLHRDL